jgi:hypothetical protein
LDYQSKILVFLCQIIYEVRGSESILDMLLMKVLNVWFALTNLQTVFIIAALLVEPRRFTHVSDSWS